MSAQPTMTPTAPRLRKDDPAVTLYSARALQRKEARLRAIRKAYDQTGTIWRVIDGGKGDEPQDAA
jgi:hypothetical protein